MAIIKLTEGRVSDESEGFKKYVSFFVRKSFFETTGAHFRETYVDTIKGKNTRCSLFNDIYIKETPEEILSLIKEAENEK